MSETSYQIIIAFLVLVIVLLLKRRSPGGETEMERMQLEMRRTQQMEHLPESTRAQIMSMLSQNNMIEAIKLYRGITGVGLKEAKDAVEAMQHHEPEN